MPGGRGVCYTPAVMSRHHTRSVANKNKVAKRHRQSERNRLRNQAAKSRVRTAVRAVRRDIATGEFDAADQNYRTAMKALDTVADKGILHKNNAARRKSRLAKALNRARAEAAAAQAGAHVPAEG